MKGYRTDHRNFSFAVHFPQSLAHMKSRPYVISRAPLESLYARIVSNSNGDSVVHSLKRLRDTPHFAYVQGKRDPYRDYLETHGRHVGFGIEHSARAFDDLLAAPAGYLEPPFQSSYIICEVVDAPEGKRAVILDGVHRAAQLLSQGVESIPIAILLNAPPGPLLQLKRYIADFKEDFLEWYTPLEIQGTVINERTYPEFKERPEFLINRQRGKSKWDFIIEKNLPDIAHKTVCDIGCNSGLFSIYMAGRGALHVTGYDRTEYAVQPTNTGLPAQNVVDQAYFVRNLFRLAGEDPLDNVDFVACDLAALDFEKLNYDVFFSCCVLYHFYERFEYAIRSIHKRIPHVFLQTNLGHKEPRLESFASIDYHKALLEKYGYSVRIDAPAGYDYPVITGAKTL